MAPTTARGLARRASILGGQFALGMTGLFGQNTTSIDGTLTASIGPFTTTRVGSISDDRFGSGDLYPTATLRWNASVNDFMVYLAGDAPVGTCNSNNLANLGIGRGAVDGGFGYTYLTHKPGMSFRLSRD